MVIEVGGELLMARLVEYFTRSAKAFQNHSGETALPFAPCPLKGRDTG
jgi:hypothetical protein